MRCLNPKNGKSKKQIKKRSWNYPLYIKIGCDCVFFYESSKKNCKLSDSY